MVPFQELGKVESGCVVVVEKGRKGEREERRKGGRESRSPGREESAVIHSRNIWLTIGKHQPKIETQRVDY